MLPRQVGTSPEHEPELAVLPTCSRLVIENGDLIRAVGFALRSVLGMIEQWFWLAEWLEGVLNGRLAGPFKKGQENVDFLQ